MNEKITLKGFCLECNEAFEFEGHIGQRIPYVCYKCFKRISERTEKELEEANRRLMSVEGEN